jgi:peptidoglycan/xylan/chitin deacetylase (PgdA/CDA1 family)/glycosyltransferase involved in cell wall biosynthesis
MTDQTSSLVEPDHSSESMSAKRKICMVSYQPTPFNCPPMYNGAVSLTELGYDVEVICISKGPEFPLRETDAQGFSIKRFHFRSRRFFHERFGLAPSKFIVALSQYLVTYTEFVAKACFSALKSRANLYEAHDLPALLPAVIAAKLRGKPVVYHAHEMYAEMHEKVRFSKFWKFLERMLVPLAVAAVTPEENRSVILYRECRAKALPLTVQNCPPYTMPIESTRLRDFLSARGIQHKAIVLYQGLFDASRCIEELVAATKHFDEGVVLVLIGSGVKGWKEPDVPPEAAGRVIFLPRVSYTDLPPYTASADIGVLFYRNNCRNNFYCAPNKLYEYMMMGLPVITCDYPGLRKVVEAEDIGVCVNPENPLAIAKAINELVATPARWEEMKQNGLRLAREKYNWNSEFEKLSNKYSDILTLQTAATGERPVSPGEVLEPKVSTDVQFAAPSRAAMRQSRSPKTDAEGNPRAIRVLMYHRIVADDGLSDAHWTCVHVRDFRHQLELMERWGFTPITFDDYRQYLAGELNLPQKPVVITFDDGYQDIYEIAFPVLQELGMKAVVFALGNRQVKTNSWEQPDGPPIAPLMDGQRLVEMHAAGFEIGSHSMNHARLTALSEGDAWEDVSRSRMLLEILLNSPVRSFSYPYGQVNESLKRVVADAGFTVACSVFSGPATFGLEPFEIRRITVRSNTGMIGLRAQLLRPYQYYGWIRSKVGHSLLHKDRGYE